MTDAYARTRMAHDPRRDGVWKVVCRYLQRFVPLEASVLDLGAGRCHFINHISARERHALDHSAELLAGAGEGVVRHELSCLRVAELGEARFNVVFASNLLEHLSRSDAAAAVAGVHRVLKPGGTFIVVQPNFKYCAPDYFDDYTHTENIHTHVSMVDFLEASGFRVEHVEGKFLPFSMRSGLPTAPMLVALYLRSPWRPFAGQMLVVARRLPQ